jgi:hypothetical protein
MTDENLIENELKIGARNSSRDAERLQQIHDFAVENGAQCAKPEVASLDDDSLILYGEPIKALDNGKIGGYLVRFSGPDDPDASAPSGQSSVVVDTPPSPGSINCGMNRSGISSGGNGARMIVRPPPIAFCAALRVSFSDVGLPAW